MATVGNEAIKIVEKINRINKTVLVGKAYPIGSGKSIFISADNKRFVAQGIVTGRAIAIKHRNTWRVIQG